MADRLYGKLNQMVPSSDATEGKAVRLIVVVNEAVTSPEIQTPAHGGSPGMFVTVP